MLLSCCFYDLKLLDDWLFVYYLLLALLFVLCIGLWFVCLVLWPNVEFVSCSLGRCLLLMIWCCYVVILVGLLILFIVGLVWIVVACIAGGFALVLFWCGCVFVVALLGICCDCCLFCLVLTWCV